MSIKSLLMCVQEGSAVRMMRIDAFGLWNLGSVAPEQVVPFLDEEERPDGLAVCGKPTAEAKELVGKLTRRADAPLVSFLNQDNTPLDPFKIYEASWKLIDSSRVAA